MSAVSNPLQGAAFDAIYHDQIEPQLARLEIERRKAMRIARIIWGATAVAAALALIWGALAGRFFNALPWVSFGAPLGVGIGFLALQSVGTRAKIIMIGALCRPLGLTYKPLSFEPLQFQRFSELGLVPPHKDR